MSRESSKAAVKAFSADKHVQELALSRGAHEVKCNITPRAPVRNDLVEAVEPPANTRAKVNKGRVVGKFQTQSGRPWKNWYNVWQDPEIPALPRRRKQAAGRLLGSASNSSTQPRVRVSMVCKTHILSPRSMGVAQMSGLT